MGILATLSVVASALVAAPLESASAQIADGQPATSPILSAPSEPVELHRGWDAYSRVAENSDGSLSRDIFSTPVNYLDSDGVWQPIDTTLVESPENGVAAESADNSFTVAVPADAGVEPVSVALSRDQWVTFRAHGSSGSPSINDSQASYNGPGDSNLNYDVTNSGVKESVVLDSAPTSAPSYTFTLDVAPGLVPQMANDGAVSVVDEQGAEVFFMPAPFMFDASDTSASEPVASALTQDGSAWKMTLTPDWSWLSSSERTYPVTIDPTVVVSGNAQTGDCWIEEAAKTTDHCGAQHVYSGSDSAGLGRRALFRFYTSSVPTDAVIQSASLSFYLDKDSTRNSNSTTYELRRVASGANWSWPTWNRASSSQAWTTPGGDFSGTSSQTVTTTGQTSGWKTWDDANVISWVQGWAANPSTNNGVAIKRTSGDNMIGWDSNQFADTTKLPKMSVTYDSYPTTPTNLGITPLDSGGKVNDAAPTLSAKVIDPDGGTVFAQFTVLNSDGSTLWSGAGSTVTSGSMSTATMPAAEIAADSSYTLQVTASDGTLTSRGPATTLGFDTIGGNVAVAGITVSSDGWITYNDSSVQNDLHLTPGAITTFDGSATGDSCTFDESTLSTAGPAIVVEVGYNPDTCQERLQVTALTDQAVNTLVSIDSAAEDSNSTELNQDDYYGPNSVDGSQPLDSVDAAEVERTTTYPNRAWAKVRWLDPLNIEITSLSESVQWTNGSYPEGMFHSTVDAWDYHGYDKTHIGTRWTHDYRRTSTSISRGVAVNFYNSSFARIVYNALGPIGWVGCGAHLSSTAYFSHDVSVRGYASGHASAWWENF